jgi:hypothetical protein
MSSTTTPDVAETVAKQAAAIAASAATASLALSSAAQASSSLASSALASSSMQSAAQAKNAQESAAVQSAAQAAAAIQSAATASAAIVSAAQGLISMGSDPVNGKMITTTNSLDQTIEINEYEARYVRVRPSTFTADGFMHLSQIMIFDDFGNNLAVAPGVNVYSKSAVAAAKPATVVIDGTTTTRSGSNCWNAATSNRGTEFIEVDLGSVKTLSSVRIIGRSDCPTSYSNCADRMKNLRVELNTTTTPDVIDYYAGKASNLQASAATVSVAVASAAQASALQASAAAASSAIAVLAMGDDAKNGHFIFPSTGLDQSLPVNYSARYVRIRPSAFNADGFIHLSQTIITM